MSTARLEHGVRTNGEDRVLRAERVSFTPMVAERESSRRVASWSPWERRETAGRAHTRSR